LSNLVKNLARILGWTMKPRLMVPVGIIGALVAGLFYGVSTLFGQNASPLLLPGVQVLAGGQESVNREVVVKGRLVFPKRAELTFESSGDVGKILVDEGEWVREGQVLARLDAVTVSELEEALAQAELDLDQAKDALEVAREEFAGTPLEKAEFEQKIARARKEKEDSEEKLDDFQRDYLRDLADAVKAQAEQKVALDEAQEKLEDFQRDSNQDLAGALTAKVDAKLRLDDALEQLGYHGRDRDQDVADAVEARVFAETTLDDAKESLEQFDKDYQEDLADARLAVGDAKNTVEAEEDALTDFIRTLGATRTFGTDEDAEENEELREIRRLQAAVQEARTNQIQNEIVLSELEGDRLLLLQARQAAVDAAQFAFLESRDKVAEVSDLSDQQLELEKRQAAVETARAKLEQADADLEDEMAGPDPLALAELEAGVEADRAKLEQVNADLEEEMAGPDQVELELRQKDAAQNREVFIDLTDGPDPFQVALKTAEVAASLAKVEDALEDFLGSTLRAPFDGRVSLVNLKIDDPVNDESRVMEIIDPRQVEVAGLVDAIDLPFVQVQALARLQIGALPGRELFGVVTAVGENPRTERGVVSYSIDIAVELPSDVVMPIDPSSVAVVVVFEAPPG